jgi:hypothetical protein
MAVWVRIENKSVQPWVFTLVFSQPEATQLSLADAREAVKAVQGGYENYLWVPAHVSGDTYVVVGQEKTKKKVFATS